MGFVPILTVLRDMGKRLGFGWDSKFCITQFTLFQVESSCLGKNWRKSEIRRIQKKSLLFVLSKTGLHIRFCLRYFAGVRLDNDLTGKSV